MANLGTDLQKQRVDDVLSFLVIKKLMTPVKKTKAFKLELVDSQGRIVRQPETDEEKATLTLFDKFMFKIKRLLGGKISQLNNFLYVQTLGNDFYNNLIVKGGVEQKAAIKRIKRDIEKVSEKYDCDIIDMLGVLMHEEVKEHTNELGFLKED